jgi:hypothetical protein
MFYTPETSNADVLSGPFASTFEHFSAEMEGGNFKLK